MTDLNKLDPTAKFFVESMLDHIDSCGLCSRLWQCVEQHRVEVDTSLQIRKQKEK